MRANDAGASTPNAGVADISDILPTLYLLLRQRLAQQARVAGLLAEMTVQFRLLAEEHFRYGYDRRAGG